MTTDLARREPRTALELVEDWAALAPDARKRRAAEALRDDDLSTLVTLLETCQRLHNRRGLRTSEHTLRSYRTGLAALARFAQGIGRKPHQLNHDDALRFARHLEGTGVGPATVNSRLAAARAFCRALQWAGMLPSEQNPFAEVSVTDPTPKHEKGQPYRPEHLERLLAAARTPRERALILLGADAGLRVAEVAALTPRERALILLGADAGLRVAEVAALTWEALEVEGLTVQVRSGKGGKTASVALTPRCADALAALGEKTGPVFGVTSRRLQALFARLCELAGVPRYGYHALRHSAGTRLYEATHDLHVTARHLRHASLDTARIYAHLADADYRSAVAQLADSKGSSPRR